MWGTIGWIVASVSFSWLWLSSPDKVENTHRIADALKIAGLVSLGYAVFALIALPKTPPKKDVQHPLAFARAFGLLAHPGFLLVTLVALPIAMIHQCYFFRSGPFFEDAIGVEKKYLGMVLGIGQASEIFFLAILGLLLKRMGYRWVLMLGAAAYAARFAIFAVGTPAPLVIASQALHGLCYGCFFAGSFLYVEKVAPADVRHSAQTVFGIIILGIGPVLAGLYNGYFDRFVDALGHQQYGQFWWTESAIALACMLILFVGFMLVPTPASPTGQEPA